MIKNARFLLLICLLLCGSLIAAAQAQSAATATAESEIKAFFDSYADDLRLHRGELIADRYEARGLLPNGRQHENSGAVFDL